VTSHRADRQTSLWQPTDARVEILVALSRILAAGHDDPEPALRDVAASVARVLRDGVAIELLSPDRLWTIPVAVDHVQPACRRVLQARTGRRLRADEGFTQHVLETGEPLLVPRVSLPEICALQPEMEPAAEAIGLRGFIAAPLLVRGCATGIVWQIRCRAAPLLCHDDRCFLQEVAARVACAVATWHWTAGCRAADADR
jgi:GAF domain-containing protein